MKFVAPLPLSTPLLLLGVSGSYPDFAWADEFEPLNFERAITLAFGNDRGVREAAAKVAEARALRRAAAGEEAASRMSVQTRKEIAHKSIEAYYRLSSVSKMKEVAQAAADTMAAHVTQAREFAAQDFLGQSEILTAEVELAGAQENLIRAQAGVSLASSALAHLLGLSLDAMLDPVDDPAASPGGLPTSLTDAQNIADQGRGEIVAHRARNDAMEALTGPAWRQLTPTLAAIGCYLYSDGLVPHNATETFAGVSRQRSARGEDAWPGDATEGSAE